MIGYKRRARADVALPTSSENLLAESSVVATLVIAADGTLTACNSRFASFLGSIGERISLGRHLRDCGLQREDWSGWLQSAREGRERNITLHFASGERSLTLRGDLLPAPDSAHDVGALHGYFIDVTEEMRLRNAMRRTARMEALGSLTSGIAHDFNNLLTVLVGNLYLVAEELRTSPQTFAKVKAARDAAKRGSDLIRQLLAFARRESVEADAVDPGLVIENLLPLLRRAIGPRIALAAELKHADGTTVRCSTAQLESVIVNLCVNARDAIDGSGKVLIKLENDSLNADAAARHGLQPGDFVRISVTDDGAGIPAETLQRVFEPFYTTKGERGGTGLGLSMVRGFAEQFGGTTYIESVPGKGTRVSILLPSSTDADAAAETGAKTMPLSTLPSGSETILVFSRDEALRATISQILEVLHYRVHLGSEPADVLAELRTRRIDLLLIDGAAQQAPAQRHLVKEATAVRPGLKVIVATDGSDVSRTRVPDGAAVLGKPFSLGELASALRRVLS